LRAKAAIAIVLACILAAAAPAADDEPTAPAPTLAELAGYLSGDLPLLVGLAAHTNTVRLTPRSRGQLRLVGWTEGRAIPVGQTIEFKASGFAVRATHGGETSEAPALEFAPDAPSGTVRFWASNGVQGDYRGSIRVVSDGRGRLIAINAVPLEVYLLGVVGSEMPSGFHLEALKAQAIVARSYALTSIGRHAEDGFDLCGTVHCQVYRGARHAPARVAQAVRETAGLIVTRDGRVVRTFYHSTCGGISADPGDVRWGAALPYRGAHCDGGAAETDLSAEEAVREFLASGAARFCRASPKYRWRQTFTLAAADALVRRNLPILLKKSGLDVGRLVGLAVAERAASGRVRTLTVETSTGAYPVRQGDIRWLFGVGVASTKGLPSTLLVLDVSRGQNGSAQRFTFTGAGWGHGLGLCQHGAQARASRGESASEIIAAYYPSCELLDSREIGGAQPYWAR
jgi:SpoIID/LytB domain protein